MRYFNGQQSKGRRLSVFLAFVSFSFLFVFMTPSSEAKKSASYRGKTSHFALNIVKKHFYQTLGVDLERRKTGQSLASVDLVKDFLVDRSKLYYALVELYQKWEIKEGETSFTNVGDIAQYLEKKSPKLKARKKARKKRLMRGVFAARENEREVRPVTAPAPAPVIAPAPAPVQAPVIAPQAPRSPLSSPQKKQRAVAVRRPAPVRAPSAHTRGFAIDDAPVAASEDASVRTVKSDDSYVQTVFYATNRQKTGGGVTDGYFNGKRLLDGKMYYGVAKVNIPFTHKKGQMELPWMGIKSWQNEKQHIYIRKLDDLNENNFFSSIAAKPTWKGREKDLLVYVHGFNVDFNEAILRAGQIAFDFGFSGTPIAFSWPSEGQTTSYNLDRADALYSAKYLELFLEKLSAKNPGRKIHIIAHSMGNQALLHGLRLMAYKNKKQRFFSVILAAPDFDAELFTQQISKEIQSLAQNWTIYTSNKDSALWASENFNAVKRLGTPLSVVEGYQIIDASELEVTPWNLAENHSYYATKKIILDDMIKVLRGVLPAERGLVAMGSAWKFK